MSYLSQKGFSRFWTNLKNFIYDSSKGSLKNLFPQSTLNTADLKDLPLYLPAGTYTLSYQTKTAHIGFFFKNINKEDIAVCWSTGAFTIAEEVYSVGFYATEQGILTDIQIERGALSSAYTPYTPLKTINNSHIYGEGNINIEGVDKEIQINLYHSSEAYKARTNISLDLNVEPNTHYIFETPDYNWTAVYLYNVSGVLLRSLGNHSEDKEIEFTTTEEEVKVKLNFFPGDGIEVADTDFSNVRFYVKDLTIESRINDLSERFEKTLNDNKEYLKSVNLYNGNYTWEIIAGDGTVEPREDYILTEYIKISSGRVTISAREVMNPEWVRIAMFDENKQFITRLIAEASDLPRTFTLEEGTKYIRFSTRQVDNVYIRGLQIEDGSNLSPYEKYGGDSNASLTNRVNSLENKNTWHDIKPVTNLTIHEQNELMILNFSNVAITNGSITIPNIRPSENYYGVCALWSVTDKKYVKANLLTSGNLTISNEDDSKISSTKNVFGTFTIRGKII